MCDFSILGRGRAGQALANAWGDRVELLPNGAEPRGWVLLAVPDHALAEVAPRFPGRCVHMSGSLELPGVPCAHPLVSFDGRAADWRGTPLAVTGEVPKLMLTAFEDIGFMPFALSVELKPLYHAAAVLTSGHAATLWLGAEQLLRDAGLLLPGRGLGPLRETTLRNILRLGAEGRTGPFARGDEETIARDVEVLPAAWKEIFLKLGRL